jgi:hypothetical protein
MVGVLQNQGAILFQVSPLVPCSLSENHLQRLLHLGDFRLTQFAEGGIIQRAMGDRPAAGPRILVPLTQVRILVPQ